MHQLNTTKHCIAQHGNALLQLFTDSEVRPEWLQLCSSSLLSKCLDLCQALCSQGQAFNFSVTIGQDFTFSMDTRRKEVSPANVVKKKASPSTRRRNAMRRQEFLNKKRKPSSKNSCELEAVSDASSCHQCDYKAASETAQEDEAQRIQAGFQ